MIVVNARLEGRNVRARVVAGRMQDGPFAAQREAFRAGRGRWDGAAASWLVPVESWPLVRRKLEESGHFKIGIGADIGGPLLPVAEPPKKSASLAPEIAERAALYPYQVEGASWLLSRYAEGRGAVLADDMGLGKTRQALAALGSSGATLGLVVCPAIARGVWKAEAEKVLPGWRVLEKSTEAEGERLWHGVPDEPCIVVVSYNCLPPVREDGTNWPGSKAGAAPREGIVIADEAHMLKSSKSDRTQRFRALARSAKRAGPGSELAIWTLTGTPVLNEPSDLWSLYQCAGVAKEAWPEGFWSFADAHGGRKNRRGHLEWEGIPDGRAKTRFRNVASRRLKTEVLALPPKTKRDVIVSLTDEERALLDGVDKKAIDKTGLVISSLTAVRAAISQGPKTRAAIAWIRQFQAERPGEPIVVFASHKQSVEAIANALGFAKILGSVRAQERAEIVRRFQAGELAGVVGTIQAMGVGVTLTRADTVLFLESDWTPELNEQAEDRLYRIGQTRPVTVVRLIADHEIDRKIEELCEFKESVHAAVLDLPADYFAKSKARSIEELRRELDARREGEAAAAREATAAREAARSALDAVAAREAAEKARQEGEAAELAAAREAAEKARQEGEAAERELAKSRTRRGPESDLERWAAEGLASVAAADGDRAAHRNDVGFSKFDGAFGHDLVRAISGGGLTAAQWRAAVKLANKYSGQIGDKPEARAEKAEQVSESESESTKTQDEDGDEARRARFAAHWQEWELTLPQTSGRRAKAIAKKAESTTSAVHAAQLKKEQKALVKELRELLEPSPGLPAGFALSTEKLLALHERFRGMNERIRKARYEAQDFFARLDGALRLDGAGALRRDTSRALRASIEELLAKETYDTFVFGEAAQVLRKIAREELENGRVPAGNVRDVLSFFARGDDEIKVYGNDLPTSPDYYEWEPLIPRYRAEKQERIEKIEEYERQSKIAAARIEKLEQERKLKEQKEREEREDAQRRVIAEARAHNASLKALGSAGKASRFFGVGWGVKAEYDGRIYWPFALGRALGREDLNKGWYVIHLPTGLSARHGLKKGEALAAVKRVVEGKLHLDPRGEADTPEALAKSGYLQELGRALTGEKSAKANHYAEDAFEQSARSEERERAERERAERERAERERAERERAERERAEREQEKNRIALEKGTSLDKLQGADGIAHYWTAGNSKSVPGNLSLCGEQWRENSGPDAWRGDVKECAKCVAVLKAKREREQEARIVRYEEARRARKEAEAVPPLPLDVIEHVDLALRLGKGARNSEERWRRLEDAFSPRTEAQKSNLRLLHEIAEKELYRRQGARWEKLAKAEERREAAEKAFKESGEDRDVERIRLVWGNSTPREKVALAHALNDALGEHYAGFGQFLGFEDTQEALDQLPAPLLRVMLAVNKASATKRGKVSEREISSSLRRAKALANQTGLALGEPVPIVPELRREGPQLSREDRIAVKRIEAAKPAEALDRAVSSAAKRAGVVDESPARERFHAAALGQAAQLWAEKKSPKQRAAIAIETVRWLAIVDERNEDLAGAIADLPKSLVRAVLLVAKAESRSLFGRLKRAAEQKPPAEPEQKPPAEPAAATWSGAAEREPRGRRWADKLSRSVLEARRASSAASLLPAPEPANAPPKARAIWADKLSRSRTAAKRELLDPSKALESNAVAFFYVGGDEKEGDPESIALRKGDVPLKAVEKYLERRLGEGAQVSAHGNGLTCKAKGYDGKPYSYTTPVKVEARADFDGAIEARRASSAASLLPAPEPANAPPKARAIWADKLSRSVLAERKKRARATKLAPWADKLSRNVAEQRKFNQALRGGWNRAAVWSAADGRQVTGFVFWPLGYGSPGAEHPAIWNLPEGKQIARSAPDTAEHRARAVKLAEEAALFGLREKAGEAAEKKVKPKKEPKASARKEEEDMSGKKSGRVAVGNQYMIVVGRQHVQAEVTGKDEDGWIVARTDTGRQMRRRRTTAELKKCECTKECAE